MIRARPETVLRAILSKPWPAEALETRAPLRLDVYDEGPCYLVLADLPGCAKEDIDVHIEKHAVSIRAPGRAPAQAQAKPLLLERSPAKASRSLELPEALDEAAAQARYADGVLSLRLPKKSPGAPRKVDIA